MNKLEIACKKENEITSYIGAINQKPWGNAKIMFEGGETLAKISQETGIDISSLSEKAKGL